MYAATELRKDLWHIHSAPLPIKQLRLRIKGEQKTEGLHPEYRLQKGRVS
jgi:hypothetical protein